MLFCQISRVFFLSNNDAICCFVVSIVASCSFCFGWLKRKKQNDVRHYVCPHDDDATTHNKDTLAAMSMLRIGLSMVLTGERLAAFDRTFAYDDVLVYLFFV